MITLHLTEEEANALHWAVAFAHAKASNKAQKANRQTLQKIEFRLHDAFDEADATTKGTP